MKEYHIHLRDMLAYAQEAGDIARTKGHDRIRKLAIERALVIIAEAAKKIPRDWQPNYPQIPWQDIIELRNIISHGYEEHTLVALESMATKEVQELVHILEHILMPQKE